MPRERVLITVKTYPTLSRKYGETVCTAGIREDGSWVRIYPVPFRRLEDEEQYRKFDWIDCDLVANPKDPRPETRRPVDVAQLRPVGHMDTARGWRDRRHLVLNTARVYSNLQELIRGAKANKISLAVFKPTRVRDLVWEEDDREWDPLRVAAFRDLGRQGHLFDDESWRQTFKLIPKLPYNFSYRFEDDVGRESKLQILDWEAGMLFWNCLKNCGNEGEAIKRVRAKYLDTFLKTDLHFFLGTTQQFHFFAPNPWVIIGVFPIPHEVQTSLF